MKPKKRRLTKREREIARKTIPEEMGRFPQRQAVAVGISRARKIAADEQVTALVRKYS